MNVRNRITESGVSQSHLFISSHTLWQIFFFLKKESEARVISYYLVQKKDTRDKQNYIFWGILKSSINSISCGKLFGWVCPRKTEKEALNQVRQVSLLPPLHPPPSGWQSWLLAPLPPVVSLFEKFPPLISELSQSSRFCSSNSTCWRVQFLQRPRPLLLSYEPLNLHPHKHRAFQNIFLVNPLKGHFELTSQPPQSRMLLWNKEEGLEGEM